MACLISAAGAELGLRAIDNQLGTRRNFLLGEAFLLGGASPAVHDAELGWVPRSGADRRYRGKHVTIDSRGLRSNGSGTPLPGRTRILAVGDSYTFGSQVGDAETWPASLERRLDARVWNGGVFNYGVDQTVLRAEGLIREVAPDVVVASLIPSDILRSELYLRGHAHKPWFELDGNELRLRGVPVPEPTRRGDDLGPLRATLGFSYAVHRSMLALAPRLWILGSGPDQRAHSNGAAVSCALLQRLEASTRAASSELAVMLQYGDERHRAQRRPIVEPLLRCLASTDVTVLDLYDPLEALRKENPAAHGRLFAGHMTPGGNAWIAERVARLLVEKGWAQRR